LCLDGRQVGRDPFPSDFNPFGSLAADLYVTDFCRGKASNLPGKKEGIGLSGGHFDYRLVTVYGRPGVRTGDLLEGDPLP